MEKGANLHNETFDRLRQNSEKGFQGNVNICGASFSSNHRIKHLTNPFSYTLKSICCELVAVLDGEPFPCRKKLNRCRAFTTLRYYFVVISTHSLSNVMFCV